MVTMLERVGADPTLRPHGVRVQGYNDSKAANGVDLTQVHGRWASESHTAYARFQTRDVANMAARMVGADAPYNGGNTERGVVQRASGSAAPRRARSRRAAGGCFGAGGRGAAGSVGQWG